MDNSNVCSVICGVLFLAPSVLAVPFAETAFIRRAGFGLFKAAVRFWIFGVWYALRFRGKLRCGGFWRCGGNGVCGCVGINGEGAFLGIWV